MKGIHYAAELSTSVVRAVEGDQYFIYIVAIDV
jgi:hypothetical protein